MTPRSSRRSAPPVTVPCARRHSIDATSSALARSALPRERVRSLALTDGLLRRGDTSGLGGDVLAYDLLVVTEPVLTREASYPIFRQSCRHGVNRCRAGPSQWANVAYDIVGRPKLISTCAVAGMSSNVVMFGAPKDLSASSRHQGGQPHKPNVMKSHIVCSRAARESVFADRLLAGWASL